MTAATPGEAGREKFSADIAATLYASTLEWEQLGARLSGGLPGDDEYRRAIASALLDGPLAALADRGAALDQARRDGAAAMLREFHEAFGLPVRSAPVAQPPESDLRTRLLAEEVQEYYDAVEADDPVEVADALADIVYVAYGSALSHGIDLDAVLAEVHRSNMSKLGADGRPVLRDDGKVIKGPAYFRPDIAALFARAAALAEQGDG